MSHRTVSNPITVPSATRRRLRELAEWVAIFAAIVLCTLVVSACSGCAGKGKSQYVSRKVITDPMTGQVVFRMDVNTAELKELPPNAAGVTTSTIGESGVTQSISGTHQKTTDQIVAENGKVFYWLMGLFLAAAVVSAFVLKAPPLAIGCAIAGGVCGVTPTFVNEIGPWLLPLGGIALLVGVTWFIVQRRASIRASQVGGEKLAAAQAAAEVNDFNRLRDELTSAITALSLNKPELAKAVKKRSG